MSARPWWQLLPSLPAYIGVRCLPLLLFVSVGALLLILTWDLRPYPIQAHVDDYRYVQSAEHIKVLPASMVRRGALRPWLGPYDTSTLFKRPGFSILLAAMATLYLPFIQTTLLLYLGALGLLSHSLLRLQYPRPFVGVLFLVGGLLPTLYDSNGVRVIREISTGAVEVAIFGLCLRLFAIEFTRFGQLFRTPTVWLLLVLLAFHWSLREEAVLLLPAVLLLVNAAIWSRSRGGLRGRLVACAIATICVLVPSRIAYQVFATLNEVSYGLRIVNEVSEGAFPRAVSALKSVDESPCDHGLLTLEEITKVKEHSRNFAVVAPALETAIASRPDMVYTDAFSIMRSAAIRDTRIGSSPQLTQQLFADIADEVETACSQGRLHCATSSTGLIVPFLCHGQWEVVPSHFAGYLFDKIGHVRHSGFSPMWFGIAGIPRIHPGVLASFERITRQKMAGRHAEQIEFSQPAPLSVLGRQDQLRHTLGSIYAATMPWLFALGAVAVLLPWRETDGSRRWRLIFAAALAVHVLGRTVAFAYLSTVDGYLNTRYISVCYPVAAVLAVVALSEFWFLYRAKFAAPTGEFSAHKEPVIWRCPAVLSAMAAAIVVAFIVAGKWRGLPPPPLTVPPPPSGVLATAAGKEILILEGKVMTLLTQRQGWLHANAGWLQGEVAVFDGWATDMEAGAPAESILLLADGRTIAAAPLGVSTPTLETGFPSSAHAGFSVSVPRKAVTGRKVRVFAVLSGGRAAELNYQPSFPYP